MSERVKVVGEVVDEEEEEGVCCRRWDVTLNNQLNRDSRYIDRHALLISLHKKGYKFMFKLSDCRTCCKF